MIRNIDVIVTKRLTDIFRLNACYKCYSIYRFTGVLSVACNKMRRDAQLLLRFIASTQFNATSPTHCDKCQLSNILRAIMCDILHQSIPTIVYVASNGTLNFWIMASMLVCLSVSIYASIQPTTLSVYLIHN